MPVGMNALTGSYSESGATSYTTASITPTANALVLAAVSASEGSGSAVPTVTGNGLTWVQVATLPLGDGFRRLTVFRAMGASPSAGAVTIDFGAVSQVRCLWSITEYTSVDTTGSNGSGAVVQSATNVNGGANTLTVTLAAFGSADNATYGAFATSINLAAATAGSGFTEIHDLQPVSSSHTTSTEWRADNDTSVDTSWDKTGRVGGIAVEVKYSAGGGGGATHPGWAHSRGGWW